MDACCGDDVLPPRAVAPAPLGADDYTYARGQPRGATGASLPFVPRGSVVLPILPVGTYAFPCRGAIVSVGARVPARQAASLCSGGRLRRDGGHTDLPLVDQR